MRLIKKMFSKVSDIFITKWKAKLHIFGMKDKKILLLSLAAIITLLVMVVGATYAFFQGQFGGNKNVDVNVTTATTDLLTFETGSSIAIYANPENFASGVGNLSDTTFARATLKANNSTNSASDNYYVYFDIEDNDFVYTTEANTAELILTVTDPDGNAVTSINGLNYVTVDDVSGFDITTATGIITIADNYAITTTGTTVQEWTLKVTFVNLDSDQHLNEGKVFSGTIKIKKEKIGTASSGDVSITADNIPSTVGRQASLNCTGSTSKWNQQYNRIEISELNANYISCNLNFTERSSKTYFNDYIIGLSGTTQGIGEVVNENGYRYEGQNPNNYVWFNNELWRIIGVFDSASHGVSDTNLVKIIRANPIGGLAWDKSNTNDWTSASLMNLLNGAYYNQEDGTNGDYCYNTSTIKSHCDYTNIGISSTYRNMIKNVTWYLGGLSSSSYATSYFETTVDNYYTYERGDTVYSSNATSTTGNIGLMYPSDYGYASLASGCARTTKLTSYNTAACTLANWLYGNGDEWTITHVSSQSGFVYYATMSGRIYYGLLTANVMIVRPVLYLDSNVYMIDGSGTESDPYIIAD